VKDALEKQVNKLSIPSKAFMTRFLIFIFCVSFYSIALAQIPITSDLSSLDYSTPKQYQIGGITVTGADHLDKNVLVMLSGLSEGDKIDVPGDRITQAIKNLWNQGLFADINITATKIQGTYIFLNIQVEERPRLSRFSFTGIRKGEADEIREKIKLNKGKIVTDNLLVSTQNIVKEHFVDKGYLNAEVSILQRADTTLVKSNNVILVINVRKNNRVKIKDIIITGNTELSDAKLYRAMKDTKRKRWYTIFHTSKYLEENFEKDKGKIIEKYNAKGFRDALVSFDTVYRYSPDRINIELKIDEGKKYYFRNITWVGNSKYSTKTLSDVLGVKRGDVYNQTKLESRLFMNQDGRDVSSLYMDDGYLFFQVSPVEILVENDSIDIEMRIYEGKQARINKITVIGNTKTNDHVIMREIRTKPGQLFSRADIIRSQRELAQLRYFNAEKLGVNPIPNPAEGTVDIEYTVEESPSDQIELSGGWGGGRVVGTLGVSFNNFSARNMFKKHAWRPLPAGDGQTLSLRAQSNGLYYQSYNASFIEPWLGGKKPNSLSVSVYHSVQTNGQKKSSETRQDINITGLSVGLGKRLKKPDDFFTLYNEISLQHYTLNNYQSFFSFSDGYSNNLSHKINIARNSIGPNPYFPTSGSSVSATLQWTPPYSYFRKDSVGKDVDYGRLTDQEKYKWIEYHKWKFTTQWYTTLIGKKNPLVLNTKAGFGFLGHYNDRLGSSPFERFYLGGDGLTGFALDGREIIALRGYDNQSVFTSDSYTNTGQSMIVKYTMELRYPFSLNPSATIYGLTFVEAGNSWSKFKDFNPFNVYRSAGVGVRVFLPMFGLLGLDYGWRFDDVPTRLNMDRSQFHFTIGANIGDL